MAGRDLLPDPPVVTGPLVWADRAACIGRAVLFDDEDPEFALAICATCPVLAACRQWALHTAVAGVAGGLTEDDRKVWRTAHGVPEPRADLTSYLPVEVAVADVENEALPDRHLRLVWPPR